MRLLLIGKRSFIARGVAAAAAAREIPCLALAHDALSEITIKPGDRVMNFALDPRYRAQEYHELFDCDLRAARAAQKEGAHFVMLSTRRIYPAERRWNAKERDPADGDETVYGRNKAESEKRVHDACGGKVGIFRLSNVFGYEYDSEGSRRSFLGLLLLSLKKQNRIIFDMHPATRRDFLPGEICAELLLDRAMDETCGTFNLGSGFPVACGELAGWIREGFGGGELQCDPMQVRDEFFLNMEKWLAKFALPVNEDGVRNYCIELGRRLRCEKS